MWFWVRTVKQASPWDVFKLGFRGQTLTIPLALWRPTRAGVPAGIGAAGWAGRKQPQSSGWSDLLAQRDTTCSSPHSLGGGIDCVCVCVCGVLTCSQRVCCSVRGSILGVPLPSASLFLWRLNMWSSLVSSSLSDWQYLTWTHTGGADTEREEHIRSHPSLSLPLTGSGAQQRLVPPPRQHRWYDPTLTKLHVYI